MKKVFLFVVLLFGSFAAFGDCIDLHLLQPLIVTFRQRVAFQDGKPLTIHVLKQIVK
ncbi:MAG: hypothetical protein IPN72_16125 [Saprospiraceae bacterium]|nr:hypothetical protein [Saprospiraceae bacterium]